LERFNLQNQYCAFVLCRLVDGYVHIYKGKLQFLAEEGATSAIKIEIKEFPAV